MDIEADDRAKQISNHAKCTEYTNTLYLILGMQEIECGLEFESIYSKTEINIVDVQIDNEKTVSFFNDQREA